MKNFDDRQFTAYFNRLTLLTLAAVLLISLGLIGFQVHNQSRNEDAQLVERMKTRALAIDNLIVGVAEQLEMLRVQAEAYFRDPRRERSVLFRALAATEPGRYSLDHIPPPYTARSVGNLTGAGPLDGLTPALAEELEMALALTPLLQGIQQNIPDAAWVYYTSARRFINIVPWVPSSSARFTDAFYDKPFFRLGLPEQNPQRARRWTPMYIDAYGKGMMVTATQPVYRGMQFLGTVSIDITLDELTRYVRSFAEESGELMIVNDAGELIAHPSATAASNTRVSAFVEHLPEALRAQPARLFQGAPMQPMRLDGHLVVWQELKNAPWKLVYVAPLPTPLGHVISKAGWVIPLLLGALTVMLITTRALTFREFIRPAESLVRHIFGESRHAAAPPGRQPPQWAPWFDEVSRAFAHNRELLSEIQHKNEQLTELNVSLARYTPKLVLLLTLAPRSGGTTVGQLLAQVLAGKDGTRSTVLVELPQSERLAQELGLDAQTPVYTHPDGYDFWLSYQLGQVPESGVCSLLVSQMLDRYDNVVMHATLKPPAESFIEQTLEPVLRYAKAVVVLVAPGQAAADATQQAVRLLKKSLRQQHAQVSVVANHGATGAAATEHTTRPEGADLELVFPAVHGAPSASQLTLEPAACALIDKLLDRVDRVHQIAAYIPTTTAVDRPLDTRAQVQRTLTFFSERFGGATASMAEGAWKSQAAGVVREQVHLVVSHATEEDLRRHLDDVIDHMKAIKKELAQEAMAIEVDRKLMLV